MMGNKERVEGKDDTMLEPIGKSLEILTFCALVDREAERVQLLRKKNSMIKPSITNSRIWHPVFELEDFDSCFRKDSPVQSGIGKEDKRVAQEKMVNVEREREERSMKRVREDDGTPPLVISKHMKCSKALRSREGLAIDLNREDDSVSSCGLLPLWYKGWLVLR